MVDTEANVVDLRQRLARTIKRRRERQHLTQAEFARQSGIDAAQTISQIERGEREVKAAELAIFAHVLHCSLADLFEEEAFVDATPSAVFAWRGRPADGAEQTEARCWQLADSYRLVETWAGETLYAFLPRFTPPSFPVPGQWIELTAEEVGQTLRLGYYPALTLRATLEERFGVMIFALPLAGSALSMRDKQSVALLLNQAEAPYRQTYSIAHEVFHLLTWETCTPQSHGVWSADIERYADRFAAALLLPREQLLDHARQIARGAKQLSICEIDEMGATFGVSRQAIIWRLHNLGSITKGDATTLIAACDQQPDARTTSVARDAVFPQRFMRLLKLVYLRGDVAVGRIAELLDQPLVEARALVRQWEEEDGDATSVRFA